MVVKLKVIRNIAAEIVYVLILSPKFTMGFVNAFFCIMIEFHFDMADTFYPVSLEVTKKSYFKVTRKIKMVAWNLEMVALNLKVRRPGKVNRNR